MASPWQEGFRARATGEGDHQNPYPRKTEEWCGWLDGWIDQDDHLLNRDAALASIGWFGS